MFWETGGLKQREEKRREEKRREEKRRGEERRAEQSREIIVAAGQSSCAGYSFTYHALQTISSTSSSDTRLSG